MFLCAAAFVGMWVVGPATSQAAPVSVDTTGNGPRVSSGTQSATLANFAIANNSDRMLVVAVGGEYSASPVSTVTFAGTPLTLSAQPVQGATASAIYYLLNPSATTGDIVVTLTGTSGNGWTFSALSLYNVLQQAPLDTKSASIAAGTNPSLTLTTPSENGFIVESLGFNNSGLSLSAASGQAAIIRDDSSGGSSGGWSSIVAYDATVGAGTSTQSWTTSASNHRYTHAAISIQSVPEPASAGVLIAGGLLLTRRTRRRMA